MRRFLRSSASLPILVTVFVLGSAALAALIHGYITREKMVVLNNPRIEIRKSERILNVYDGEQMVRTYGIGLGSQPAGGKEREGDGKTPEGEFHVFVRNPSSKFHLSLGISYPAPEDGKRGFDKGMISRSELEEILKAAEDRSMPPQKTALGGEIYIHGNGSGIDWTQGCIALDDNEMEELFEMIPVGTQVLIVP